MFERGTQIAYVPTHVNGDLKHPDVQFGFVMSRVLTTDEQYFCRYWRADLKELRTKANSELTAVHLLVEVKSVPEVQIKRAIIMIELGY